MGSSPGDFPEEHYERTREGRFGLDDFHLTGRRGSASRDPPRGGESCLRGDRWRFRRDASS
jgi:hypothetical protein